MELQTGIHCKLAYNGEYRRFQFNGTEFHSLLGQIRSILNLPSGKEFVLKYTDEEGDMITITSDEELQCALGFSKNPNLLRLTVVVEEKEIIDNIQLNFGEFGCRRGKGRGRGRCGDMPYERKCWKKGKDGEKWKKHWKEGKDGEGCEGKWRKHWKEGKDGEKFEGKWKKHCMEEKDGEKFEGKWKKHCMEEKDGEKFEGKWKKHCMDGRMYGHGGKDGWDVEKLKMKKQRLQEVIERLSNIPKEEGNWECREKRILKMKEKLEGMESRIKEMDENWKNNLTPEEKEILESLNERTKNLKEMIHEIKRQIREKKCELRECKVNMDSTQRELFFDQIKQMKGTIFDLKNQIRDLNNEKRGVMKMV